MRKHLHYFVCLFAIAVIAHAAPVDCPASCSAAYAFSTAPVTSDSSQLSFGFEFSTTAPVTISAFGYYDADGDGLAVAHEVGLFDSAGALLAFAQVDPGTSNSLIGSFRYASIAPISIAAGESFTIAATTGGAADPWAYGIIGDTITGFASHTAIQIGPQSGVYVYTPDSGLGYPVEHFRYSLYAGPNFLIQEGNPPAPIPEPASSALLTCSIGAMFLIRRTFIRRP